MHASMTLLQNWCFFQSMHEFNLTSFHYLLANSGYKCGRAELFQVWFENKSVKFWHVQKRFTKTDTLFFIINYFHAKKLKISGPARRTQTLGKKKKKFVYRLRAHLLSDRAEILTGFLSQQYLDSIKFEHPWGYSQYKKFLKFQILKIFIFLMKLLSLFIFLGSLNQNLISRIC